MIKIVVRTHAAQITHIDNEAEGLALKKALTFIVPGFRWMKRYKTGQWDGTFCFLNRYSMSFPTGLLDILPRKLAERIVKIDLRKKPEGQPVAIENIGLNGVEFRDYQIELVKKAIGKERCVVQSPTNAGKTEISAGIIKGLGVSTLFLTHIDNLCRQTRERLENRLQIKVGIINAREWDQEFVTVCMIPTLYHRLKRRNPKVLQLLNSVDALFLDEVHHLSAESWLVVAKQSSAYYRFGLSATPVLKDAISNLKLIGQTGGIVGDVTNKDLIEQGISAKPIISIVTNVTMGGGVQLLNYQRAYRLGIETNVDRNILIAKIIKEKMKENKPTLVLVNTIRHQRELERTFLKLNNGFMEFALPRSIVILNGGINTDTRMRTLKDMSKGNVKVIIATPIFDEGMDMPEIKVLVLGGGGKSQIKLLQRVGRGMRKKKEGENVVEIFDFKDTGQRYLSAHAKRRLGVYEREGFDIKEVVR